MIYALIIIPIIYLLGIGVFWILIVKCFKEKEKSYGVGDVYLFHEKYYEIVDIVGDITLFIVYSKVFDIYIFQTTGELPLAFTKLVSKEALKEFNKLKLKKLGKEVWI